MAQANKNNLDSASYEDRSKDDSFKSDEWTIIDDKESNDSISINNSEENNTNNNNNISDNNDEDNEEDDEESIAVEKAKEAVQVLNETACGESYEHDESQLLDNSALSNVPALKDDDSDGISVITESEKNDDSFYKNIAEIIVKPIDNGVVASGTLIHIVVACLLAAAIGFGIGCYVSPGKTQMSTNDVNFKPTEREKFLNDVNKRRGESPILPNLIRSQSVSVEPKTILEEMPRVNIDEFKNDDYSLREILKHVRMILNTLCKMFDDGKPYPTSMDYACSHSSLFNLIDLKDNVEKLIALTGFDRDNLSKRIAEDMDLRIKNISLSFFEDISKSIKTSVTKVNRKLSKIKGKLYQTVCLIEYTMGNDPKVLNILKKQNYLGANCTKNPHHEKYDVDVRRKEEKKYIAKPEKIYSHPIGPDVNKYTIDERRDIEQKHEQIKSNDFINKNEKHEKNREKKKYKQQKEWKNEKEYHATENDKSDDNLNAKLIQDTSRLQKNKFKDDSTEFDDRNYEKDVYQPKLEKKNSAGNKYDNHNNYERKFNDKYEYDRKFDNNNSNEKKSDKKYNNYEQKFDDAKVYDTKSSGKNDYERKFDNKNDYERKFDNNNDKQFDKSDNEKRFQRKNGYEKLNYNDYDNYDNRDGYGKKYDNKDDYDKNFNNKNDYEQKYNNINEYERKVDNKNEYKNKKYDNNKKDSEKFCQTDSCSNMKNNDRKYSREKNSDNWQFKRSEGRSNLRSELKPEDETTSWDYNRAKGRENARSN